MAISSRVSGRTVSGRRTLSPLIAVLLAGLLAALVAGCTAGEGPANGRPAGGPAKETPAGPDAAVVRVGTLSPLHVEVARTSAEQSRGLSGRDRLAPGSGMLFVFDSPTTTGFWMHDVHFPLSLAWIRDRRVIGTVEMTPCLSAPSDCRTYEPPEPYTMVVEAGADTFADVTPGTRVRVRFTGDG